VKAGRAIAGDLAASAETVEFHLSLVALRAVTQVLIWSKSVAVHCAAAVRIPWGFFHATLHRHQLIAGIVLMVAVAMVQRAQAAVEPV
jgi:hypothetical protein